MSAAVNAAVNAVRAGRDRASVNERSLVQVVLTVFLVGVFGGNETLDAAPLIQRATISDPLFRQHQADLQSYYRVASRSAFDELVPTIYEYQPREEDDLLGVCAEFGLRPDTVATLNGLETLADFDPGEVLLIPNVQGVFVPVSPRNLLDELMASWRSAADGWRRLRIPTGDGMTRSFVLFVDEAFHPIERAYFLGHLLRPPLERSRLTSAFGVRADPFTGHQRFHGGIDLAAPAGTDVRAARSGTVTDAGSNRVYGTYVVVSHPGAIETLYGHLSRLDVAIGDRVANGALLGTVGATGLATGPHLHFEVRRRGERVDPLDLIPGTFGASS